MKIQSLTIQHLRNHEYSTLEFSPEINVITGRNGEGKTTILEAIALCALSKTFTPSSDTALIARSAPSLAIASVEDARVAYNKNKGTSMEVEGDSSMETLQIKEDKITSISSLQALTDLDIIYEVAVQIAQGERKRISSSLGKNLSPKDIVGEIPIVVLSPDYRTITAGSPADRRKFIDGILSQASRTYLDNLLRLRQILKQRNALFTQGKKAGYFSESILGLISTWTEALIQVGSEIVVRRASFLRGFLPHVLQAYRNIAGTHEDITIAYQPRGCTHLLNDILRSDVTEQEQLKAVRQTYQTIAEQSLQDEQRRATTIFGPQKDEILMAVNGGVARETASQGQHKSLLIALKMAEFAYLKQLRNETPIILLDDIFSELDTRRAHQVLQLVRSDAQTFITTTDRAFFETHASGEYNYKLFEVSRGAVTSVEENMC
jgi:DNA replication and repair protein RecF